MPARKRRGFGHIRKLPSGRWRATYAGPDGLRHKAPATFDTRGDAEAWLAGVQTDISRGEWQKVLAAGTTAPTFTVYAEGWLAGHHSLRPRTRAEYRKILTTHVLPTFGDQHLDHITPAQVRLWHADLAAVTGPTRQAHAYGLLRAILNTVVADDLIATNPCRVKGAGQTKRARRITPATLAELEVISEAMPAEYRAAVLVAAWLGLRFGELAELRRADVDLRREVVHVTRAVTVVGGEAVIGPPKSEAGVRDVAIPPHLLPVLREHLRDHVPARRDALLFPAPTGGHLRSDGKLHRAFHQARTVAGRDDLRIHDLRHTGATLAAATGATLAELMARIGHSTPAAAMRYQHASADRDKAIAAALSKFAAGKVVTLEPKQTAH